jgi:phage FluMu protein Com
VERDWRCSRCGILLARVGDGGVTICRGELQATMTGEFQASVVCYRPRCRALNVLRVEKRTVKQEMAKT